MKETLFVWLYKSVEIFLCGILGYALFFIISTLLNQTIGIISVSVIFYFWGGLIRPYFKELQEYIFDKD